MNNILNALKSKFSLILFILTLALFLLSLAYLVRGFYLLAISPLPPKDLFSRWQEQQYIYSRIYPYGMSVSEINPQLGKITSGGYPPWAFFTGFFIFPNISWTLTRFYQMFLNLLSLGVLVRFAYQIGLSFGVRSAYFFVAACLAISSHCTTLGVGQYGIIINALLIGVYWLIKANRNNWAGLLMGIALAKPTISAPYFLGLIIHRKFKSFFVAIFYISFATFYISWLTKLDLNDVIFRFLDQIKYVADDGFSWINILINLGLNVELSILLLGAISISLIILIFYWLRDFSLLIIFGIASAIGRIFTYHRVYDDIMLVFLLLALLQLAFSQPHWLNILILTVVGLTLWLPASFQNVAAPYWLVLQIIIWSLALIYLLLNSLATGYGKDEANR
jgi:hypothetical protein